MISKKKLLNLQALDMIHTLHSRSSYALVHVLIGSWCGVSGFLSSGLDVWRWLTASFFPAGQWKQCCDDLMKIELPSPRKPALVTSKQGSLYHEIGKTATQMDSERVYHIVQNTFIWFSKTFWKLEGLFLFSFICFKPRTYSRVT